MKILLLRMSANPNIQPQPPNATVSPRSHWVSFSRSWNHRPFPSRFHPSRSVFTWNKEPKISPNPNLVGRVRMPHYVMPGSLVW